MRTLLHDLQYGCRNLLKSPGFAAVVALTLAIGMGANTAIFSVIDSILLRPLPFPEPDRLVSLYETEAAPGHYPLSPPDFLDWRAQNSTLRDMALYSWPVDLNVSGQGVPERITGSRTQADFFSVLGVHPLLGRTWVAGEDQPGKDDVVILSYSLWRSRFAGDPGVIGRSVELNARKCTVIGVMAAHMRFPEWAEVWIPQPMDSKTLGIRGNHWLRAVGRLKPNVPVRRAQAELSLIAARLERQYPDSNDKVGAAVVALRDDMIGNSRASLWMMLAVVGFVLLIACANVANLLLSKALARQKEMAIRTALGAARWRLLRQLLTESLLLSAIGGVLGLAVARATMGLFTYTRARLPNVNTVELNGTVLAFAAALVVATSLVFGIVPALQTSRPELHEELKGAAGGSNSPGRRRRFTSDVLVVAEMALSLLLLISAGLLLKNFTQLRNIDIGVRTEGVWTAATQLPEASYKTWQQIHHFKQRLIEETRRIPGVEAAAATNRVPPEGGGNYYISLPGQTREQESGQLVEQHSITPDYFHALGIRLLQGRNFTEVDVERGLQAFNRLFDGLKAGAPPAPAERDALVYPVVINETMARFFWPDRDPLGQRFGHGDGHGPWAEVIGVVSDVRQRGLADRPAPEAYDVFGDGRFVLVLRTSGSPARLAAEVHSVLRRMDRSLPLFSVRTMDEVVADNAQGQQFLSVLVGSFAALALLLAALGIYGVLSYAVTQRTREIGIRMSLGATRGRVLYESLRQGMALALIGSTLGIAGAVAARRLIGSLLTQVEPGDPSIYIGAAALLAIVALAACYLPARRAARVDPMTALHYE
jgi:putative ABC transport system permease protein